MNPDFFDSLPEPDLEKAVRKDFTFTDTMVSFRLGFSLGSRIFIPRTIFLVWLAALENATNEDVDSYGDHAPTNGTVCVYMDGKAVLVPTLKLAGNDGYIDAMFHTMHVKDDRFIWHMPVGIRGKCRLAVKDAPVFIKTLKALAKEVGL